jgi:hypothetical protein
MRIPSGLTMESSNTAHATGVGLTRDDGVPGWGAQTLIVALIGVAGALFVFAAFHMLGRAATAKVRKR